MKRFASVTGLRPEMAERYKELHSNVWPEVLAELTACNISNYSIFVHDDQLFSYLEYHGSNWADDNAKMAASATTQEWWALTDPCQVRPAADGGDRPWVSMMEVFHHD